MFVFDEVYEKHNTKFKLVYNFHCHGKELWGNNDLAVLKRILRMLFLEVMFT